MRVTVIVGNGELVAISALAHSEWECALVSKLGLSSRSMNLLYEYYK